MEYRRQLAGGLNRAIEIRDATSDDVVIYVFVANLRKIGQNQMLQKVYRKFVERAAKDLQPMGRIRYVLMRASEFSTALKRLLQLYDHGLGFESNHLAEAFDTLHEIMLGDAIPNETDWMAKKMEEIVTDGVERDQGILATKAPQHPALGPVAGPSG